MPYKDPEKRRRYNTLYKERWRRERAKNMPGIRIFVCPRFPFLRFGLVQFQGGFLITTRMDEIDEVLQHPDYYKFIFPVAVDSDLSPIPSLDEEE
jgi:hypothetical protein